MLAVTFLPKTSLISPFDHIGIVVPSLLHVHSPVSVSQLPRMTLASEFREGCFAISIERLFRSLNIQTRNTTFVAVPGNDLDKLKIYSIREFERVCAL